MGMAQPVGNQGPIYAELSTSPASTCDRCNGCGDKKTYDNQACLPLNGRVVCIDWCIHHIVAALNAGGVRTVASCCGHGETHGRIDLEDGRVLLIQERKPNSIPQ